MGSFLNMEYQEFKKLDLKENVSINEINGNLPDIDRL